MIEGYENLKAHGKDDCRKGYHIWKVIREDAKGIGEVCMECGKKKEYSKFNGRMDNKEYAEAHKLDILQPHYDGTYEKFYGQEKSSR